MVQPNRFSRPLSSPSPPARMRRLPDHEPPDRWGDWERNEERGGGSAAEEKTKKSAKRRRRPPRQQDRDVVCRRRCRCEAEKEAEEAGSRVR
ncbi:hypothetical protein MRX96_000598 [Rhipicephalus microplus]